MFTIKCAGVPEHFNHPWIRAISIDGFSANDINLEWRYEAGGTGAMARQLQNGELDMAVLLTEGAVTEILKQNPFRILSFYVDSSLTWGVHTSSDSIIYSGKEISNYPVLISRVNSGSHLMAHVFANKMGESLKNEQFVTISNLAGARKFFKTNPNQLFLWEKFTTKPLVDNGEFICLDYCPTPWPSFVVVVREGVYQNNEAIFNKTIDIVQEQAIKLKMQKDGHLEIAQEYGLKRQDAAEWFKTVEWSKTISVDPKLLLQVCKHLYNLGIINEEVNLEKVKQKLLFDRDLSKIM